MNWLRDLFKIWSEPKVESVQAGPAKRTKRCPRCGRYYTIRKDNRMRKHWRMENGERRPCG